MLKSTDARRRWWGAFFLTTALALLFWGQILLQPYLTGLLFIGYWLLCFIFTGLALLTALVDMWVVRRRTRLEQRRLIEHALTQAQHEANQKKTQSSNSSPKADASPDAKETPDTRRS